MNKLVENNVITIGFIIGFIPIIMFIILCIIFESTTKKECIEKILYVLKIAISVMFFAFIVLIFLNKLIHHIIY